MYLYIYNIDLYIYTYIPTYVNHIHHHTNTCTMVKRWCMWYYGPTIIRVIQMCIDLYAGETISPSREDHQCLTLVKKNQFKIMYTCVYKMSMYIHNYIYNTYLHIYKYVKTCDMYIYIYIWKFPEFGCPQNNPWLSRINLQFWVTYPHLWNPPFMHTHIYIYI